MNININRKPFIHLAVLCVLPLLNACTLPSMNLGIIEIGFEEPPKVSVVAQGKRTYLIDVSGSAGQKNEELETVFTDTANEVCSRNHGIDSHSERGSTSGIRGLDTLLVKNGKKGTIVCQ